MRGLGVCPLGSTGLTVSRIGLGLAALGRPGYINLAEIRITVRIGAPPGDDIGTLGDKRFGLFLRRGNRESFAG